MEYNLTEGSITGKLLKFAFPLMIGNLLQQCYNIADTLIVGRFLGADALAAVGSAYTLMVFLTSIILGLCMGSSAFFSMQFGAGFRKCLFHICGAEFRGRKKRPDPQRNEKCSDSVYGVLPGCECAGIYLCGTVDEDLY